MPGYLVECKNHESVYQVMKQFLQMSTEERREMGLKGRDRMIRIFEKKAVVADTIKYLNI